MSHVERRKLLTATGALFGSASLMALGMPAIAQQPQGVPRIGFLTLQSLETDSRLPAFIAGMRELGYVEGKTVAIEWRSAGGNAALLPGYAEELVRLKVALIVAAQPQAIDAARRATSTVPIVFVVAQDPVGSGYAKSLAQPGGTITGLSIVTTDVSPKQVELLRSALPNCSRIAVLLNRTNTGSPLQLKAIEAAARKIDLSVQTFYAATRGEVEQAFVAASRERAEAVIVTGDAFLFQLRAPIAELALRHRLPTVFTQREHAVAGGMMSFGPSVTENYRRVARYVDRILKGAKPGELPIEQPTKFDLVINLKTARTLGLSIPVSLLARADEVIQ